MTLLSEVKKAVRSRVFETSKHRAGTSACASVKPVETATSLMIACPSPTTEDRLRDSHRLRGQYLARQELWDDLSAEVRAADHARALTPAGMSVAELLCFGARSDVVSTVEHMLTQGQTSRHPLLLKGIEAMETMLVVAPHDPVRAVIVAQTHLDIGWAWRGAGWRNEVPARNLAAFEAHFDRARDILSTMTDDNASPLVCAARSALNASGVLSGPDIARDYENLIDLNPTAPAPMRAMGYYLTPRWYGSYERLELEARRTAARTHAQWAAGGYSWVLFDALAVDPLVCQAVDVEFFIEGLENILERMPDQHTVNTLAAFCARTLGSGRSGDPETDAKRRRIADCVHWIVRRHLTELHPLIWAHASAGFDNSISVPSQRQFAASGRQGALSVIATLFQTDIAAGRRIIFTAEGPVAEYC